MSKFLGDLGGGTTARAVKLQASIVPRLILSELAPVMLLYASYGSDSSSEELPDRSIRRGQPCDDEC